ncbi:class A beta-lactamase-related serine hydrolase [Embleya sp. NBC_00888]|uniref:serine hydrolase n=1 Tax=Embleya sp. NBC_00888 TaxID=2975960 RepID=UPI0038630A5A|nr:class A beta-lactamase-related serine hydrolase [Embleya sp. NBC_00888]
MSPAREGTHRAARRGRSVLTPLAVVLACATLLWMVVSGNRAEPTSFSPAPTASSAADPPAVPPESTEPTLPSTDAPTDVARGADRQLAVGPTSAGAASALAAALPEISGNLSVAILDPAGGEPVGYNTDRSYVTASIVKVDILAALLLRTQQEHRTLTTTERATAAAMIERSDNDAADTLWSAIGGAAGLRTANATLGLTETEPTGLSWGLTRTTATDQVRLLDAITATDSPLDAGSRAYLADLMTSVEDDQTWGVATAADPDTTPALKNGWLPRDATGLWVINSIGHITRAGRPLLIAILSDDQPSMPTGITQLEAVARAAVPAVVTAAN